MNKKIADGEISEADKKEILRMAQGVSNTFTMLPALRDVLVPTSAFRASYAVNKFARLHAVLYLKDIEQHIQRNVDELVIFLNHFLSMQLLDASVKSQAQLLRLQKDVSQMEDKLKEGEATVNRIGVIIALIALLVAGPSLLQDSHSFFVEYLSYPEWVPWIFFALIGLTALTVIWYFRNPIASREFWNKILKIQRHSKQ